MTKRQAHTLTALAVAIIVTQILCTAVLMRGMERTRRAVEAAQVAALNTPDQEKTAIATNAEGEAIQADEPSITVDLDSDCAAVTPAAPPTPPAIAPHSDEIAGEMQSVLRETQQAQERMDAAIADARRNAAAARPALPADR